MEFFKNDEKVEFLGEVIGRENEEFMYKITMPVGVLSKDEALEYIEEWYANRIEYAISSITMDIHAYYFEKRWVAYVTIIPTKVYLEK